MRTTIACNRCRFAKVKCHYDGKAPCRACVKTGHTETCVLTGPVLHKSAPPSAASASASPAAKRKDPPGGQTTPDSDPEKKPRLTPTDAVLASSSVDDLLASISTESLLQAMHIFRRHYPELAILHPHDFDDLHGDQLTEVDKLRYLAIYSVSRRSMPDATAGPSASDIGAAVSRHFKNLSDDPSLGLPLIHIQLLLAICEWGNGQTLKAWMTVGAAGRLCIGALNVTSSSPAVERHTLWACFTLERQLSCGRKRPTMFPSGLALPLPSSELKTSLGDDPASTSAASDVSYGVIAEGLMIWSRITSWLVDGGRKQFGMTDSHNCPWKASSVWDGMKVDLQRWRNEQAPAMRYPETKMSSHAVRNTAETFALVNLVYYVGVLNLCREWIPLLPVGEQVPRGPIDQPYLPEAGPREFWLHNRDILLDAAEQITRIHEDLWRCGVSLQTPFTGFCLFGALTCHQYAESFPAFAGPDIASRAPSLAHRSIGMLRRFSETWRIGKDWLQIIDKSHIVYKRANANRFCSRRETRYDHAELEDAIISASPEHYVRARANSNRDDDPTNKNQAPHINRRVRSATDPPREPQILERPGSSHTLGSSSSNSGTEHHHHHHNHRYAPPPSIMTAAPTSVNNSSSHGFMGHMEYGDQDPESWRLWLFGEDPQLFPLPGDVDPSFWAYSPADGMAGENKDMT